jgi:imidazolonepropionase-like amidohydrolase
MHPSIATSVAVLLLASAAHAQSPAGDTVRYAIVSSGRPAGVHTMWVSPSGERRYLYEFNDRGRGPRFQTRIVLGPGGVPRDIETLGHGYFKDSVEERFSRDERRARWTTPNERGDTSAGASAFYVTENGVPEETAILARALLAAPGRRLPLLPAGEASIEKVGDVAVRADGAARTVTHYAISGMTFTPIDVWLDQGGGYFGSVSSWMSVVRQGWESVVPQLVRYQDSVTAARVEATARTLGRRPSGALLIHNARLLDVESGQVRPGTSVLISGSRIQAVGRDGELRAPAGAEVVDARGRLLMPGMWDMHVHVGPGVDGLQYIAAGITSARDMGNDTTTVLELRKKFDAGTLVGPRLVLAGLIDGPGPFQVPTGALASNEAEGRRLIDRYKALGFEQIKLYSSLDTALVAPLARYAHERGLRVSGHIPSSMTAERAVRLGYDEIQHGNMLMLNFLADSVPDTRSTGRFHGPARLGATIDLRGPAVRDFVALLKERRVVIDPTLAIFEGQWTSRKGEPAPMFKPVVQRFPPMMQRGMRGGDFPVPPGLDGRYRESFARMRDLVGMVHEAGVQVVAGTDAFPGVSYHRELELYVDAGIPAPEVLRIATLGAARVAKRDRELGTVAPGKLADVILVDGDPTQRIGDIRNVTLVVKDGVIYEPRRLYGSIGVK